jgi:hypothetical protein
VHGCVFQLRDRRRSRFADLPLLRSRRSLPAPHHRSHGPLFKAVGLLDAGVVRGLGSVRVAEEVGDEPPQVSTTFFSVTARDAYVSLAS